MILGIAVARFDRLSGYAARLGGSHLEHEELVDALRRREVKETDGPLARAPKLSDELLVSAGVASLVVGPGRLASCRFLRLFLEGFLEVKLLDAFEDRQGAEELSNVELGLHQPRLQTTQVMLRELLIHLGLISDHFFDDEAALLLPHGEDRSGLDLVLRHVGDLQHQVRILQILADCPHLGHDLVDSIRLKKLFLH